MKLGAFKINKIHCNAYNEYNTNTNTKVMAYFTKKNNPNNDVRGYIKFKEIYKKQIEIYVNISGLKSYGIHKLYIWDPKFPYNEFSKFNAIHQYGHLYNLYACHAGKAIYNTRFGTGIIKINEDDKINILNKLIIIFPDYEIKYPNNNEFKPLSKNNFDNIYYASSLIGLYDNNINDDDYLKNYDNVYDYLNNYDTIN